MEATGGYRNDSLSHIKVFVNPLNIDVSCFRDDTVLVLTQLGHKL